MAFLPYCTSVNMPTTVWKPRRRLNDLQIYDLIMTRELTRSADSSAPSILHQLWFPGSNLHFFIILQIHLVDTATSHLNFSLIEKIQIN